MANFQLDINSEGMVVFTNKLEKLHRSALPVAIRQTLNKMAFDVKQNTMLQEAKSTFVQRRKTFFKARSRVSMAKGFDMKSMKAMVGFTGGDENQAVRDLEQQEHGGTIGGRSFIPMKTARTGSNKNRTVRKNFRLGNIDNIVNARKVRGKNKQERFTKAAIKAGAGGFVLGNFADSTLWAITSLKRDKFGNTRVRKTPLYTYEDGRSVRIKKPTHFMEKASMKTFKKVERFYKAEALRQIKRLQSK